MSELSEEQTDNANRMIGRLHNRIHTMSVGNYYVEQSQDYDKVLQIFIRANSAGQPLEYSDLLLSTATAKWETFDARSEIHDFTDKLNGIGASFKFGKDFVLKACLYLCESLPIQYKLKNFTKPNLLTIEQNWEEIKKYLATTVRLISRFGFYWKNIVTQNALLPIAFYLMKRGDPNFDTSSGREEVEAQEAIRIWFVFSNLKRAFGGSSDTTLTRLRDLLESLGPTDAFPSKDLYKSLEIEPTLNDAEIERVLEYKYQGQYTNLVLSLLYPDKHWKDTTFEVDHIYPQAEFNRRTLKARNYDDAKIESYLSRCNALCNLQLLTETENRSKSDISFDKWIETQDESFQARHLIPKMHSYDFEEFVEFSKLREEKIVARLKAQVDTSILGVN